MSSYIVKSTFIFIHVCAIPQCNAKIILTFYHLCDIPEETFLPWILNSCALWSTLFKLDKGIKVRKCDWIIVPIRDMNSIFNLKETLHLNEIKNPVTKIYCIINIRWKFFEICHVRCHGSILELSYSSCPEILLPPLFARYFDNHKYLCVQTMFIH